MWIKGCRVGVVGRDLLTHAVGAALALSGGQSAGPAMPISVMAIKALNEEVASFYKQVGFQAFDPDNPLELVRSIRELMSDYEAAMIQIKSTRGAYTD